MKIRVDLRIGNTMARFLKFDGVSFAYDGMSGNLLEDVDAYFPEGEWTGIVGAKASVF